MPSDGRKGFAFPRASCLTIPLSSTGRLSLPVEPRGEMGGGPSRKARGFPHVRRHSRFSPDVDTTLPARGAGGRTMLHSWFRGGLHANKAIAHFLFLFVPVGALAAGFRAPRSSLGARATTGFS